MKIDCRNIASAPGGRLEFDYPLELSQVEWAGEFPFPEPGRAVGAVVHRLGILELQARVCAAVHTCCARCLAPVNRPVEAVVDYVLTQDAGQEDEESVVVVDGDVIELDDILIPALLLELDMVYLCRPDCRGLCPHCGADLNGGDCSCQKPGDDRLAALQQWLEKNGGS